MEAPPTRPMGAGGRPVPIVIAVSPIVSGVVTWALRLREAMRSDPDFEVRLVSTHPDVDGALGADAVLEHPRDLARYLRAEPRGIVVPNYVWPYYFHAAARIARGGDWRVLGYCHADSAKEYYEPLRECAPIVSRFVAVSPWCAKTLAGYLPERRDDVETLPYFVEVPASRPERAPSPPLRIVYAGRLVQEQKRIFDLPAVLARLDERRLPFRFVIAGEGAQEATLRSLLGDFVARGQVEFLGKLSPAATIALWRSAHVFFQCSEFEGTSVSMLEAMGQGCVPVVTRTASGIDEIVEHGRNGWLFEIGDSRGAAEGIEEMVRSPSVLLRRSEAALESSRAFTAAPHVARLKRIWRETLESPARRQAARAWHRERRIAHLRHGVNVWLYFQMQALRRLRPSAVRAFVTDGDR